MDLSAPKQKIITISSRFTKMPYSTRVTDVGNQLAKTLYGAQNMASIIGKARNVRTSNLKNTTIRVIMPRAKSPVEKQDKNCRAMKDRVKRKKAAKTSKNATQSLISPNFHQAYLRMVTFPCSCTKCIKPDTIDQKCIDVVNAIKTMIKHGIHQDIDIVF